MSVTMKDIAAMTGVSVVTVSRALNDKPDISSKTKKRILEIADELGYTPNTVAKSLVTRKTYTIGVLIPDTKDTFFAEIIQGIADECFEHGYSIDLCHTNSDADRELEFIRLLRGKRVEGMIIYPVQEDDRYIEELGNSAISYIFMNRHTDALNCDYVINDNIHGAFLAVDHLIKRGHRRIVYICAKPTVSSGIERIEGSKKAMVENGLPSEFLNVVTCEAKIECSYRCVKELLADDKNFSAIFVWDDKLAVGVYRAVFETGMRIPQDIAIVGYNDMEISEYIFPPLTTIRQASYHIGEKAAHILLEKITSDVSVDVKKVVLKPELIIRSST